MPTEVNKSYQFLRRWQVFCVIRQVYCRYVRLLRCEV